MKKFRQLHKGVKRLLLLISILLSVVILIISFGNVNSNAFSSTEGIVLVILYLLAWTLGTFLVFWAIVRLILWVIDGYKEPKV